MSQRVAQRMLVDYTCDECGISLQGDTQPESWANVQYESYAAVGGRVSSRLDLCSTCIQLPKYEWTRS